MAPGCVDVVGPYLRHLVTNHVVLLSDVAGRAVAFGSMVDTGRAHMLGDLYVLPEHTGQGVGRPLLAALYGDARVRVTLSSDDPRAMPLYIRAGMTPLWVNLYMEGLPARLPDSLSAIRVRTATPAECWELELAWTGAHRAADHEFWASQGGADTFVAEDGEGAVAFGYARAKQITMARAVDRLLVRPGADPVAPAIAGIARAARGGPVQTCIFGPNPLVPVLLEAGFRIIDHDQFLASDPALIDPLRLLPNPGML